MIDIEQLARDVNGIMNEEQETEKQREGRRMHIPDTEWLQLQPRDYCAYPSAGRDKRHGEKE